MAEETLAEANFEPINFDPAGNLQFETCLSKLRRSFVGMHNKVFPVYILGTSVRWTSCLGNGLAAGINGTVALLTTDANRKTFLTNIKYSWSANAASTGPDIRVEIVQASSGGGTVSVARTYREGSVSEHGLMSLDLQYPIELKKGSVINLIAANAAGTLNIAWELYGYVLD